MLFTFGAKQNKSAQTLHSFSGLLGGCIIYGMGFVTPPGKLRNTIVTPFKCACPVKITSSFRKLAVFRRAPRQLDWYRGNHDFSNKHRPSG